MQEFLEKVLPKTGIYVLAYKDEAGLKQRPVADKQAMLDFVAQKNPLKQDCWFAPASYTQGWYEVTNPRGETRKRLRTKENVSKFKALWLDIDVGEGKDYATRSEAISAVVAFKNKLNLPTPYVVYSGATGIHLYWAIEEEIDRATWERLAGRLFNACEQEGLRADPSRTRDCASLMRLPNTYNVKAEPVLVTVAKAGVALPLAKYEEIFTPYASTAQRTLDNQEFKGGFDAPNADDVVKSCAQMRLQEGAVEPIWRGMLATLRHCNGGEQAIHELSKQDPRYDPNDVNQKLNYLEDNAIPPFTCEYFNEHRPEVCATCPLKGLIKSPISAPKSLSPAEKEMTVEEVVNKPKQNIPTIETFNFRVNETGCYIRQAVPDGEPYWAKIYDYPVYPLQRIKDRTPAGDIITSYIFRRHHFAGYDDFQISGETLMGQGVNGFLGSVGFLLQEKERKKMSAMLIDLLRESEHRIETTKIANQLGWDEEFKSFLLGNKLYKSDGTVVEVAPKGQAAEFSNQTVARGSLETWKKIAGVYNKDGFEWAQAVVATAFASPLMPIGALEKSALLFVTGEAGAGKSTALSVAVSVFGNPTRLMINKDDTYLARIAKLGMLNNISAGFDEMTKLSPKEASELAYQITQGRGKDRMSPTGEHIQHNSTYWSCLPVMSANDSILNALSQYGLDSTAQMSRVLEVRATDINKIYQSHEERWQMEQLVREVPSNYGTAGDVYMRYITTHTDQVKDLIYKFEKEFVKHSKLTNNHRFWTYMCVRMLVGVAIANKLGLVEYNVAKLFKYFLDLVKDAKGNVETQRWTNDYVFSEFLSSQVGNRLIVTHANRPAHLSTDDPSKGQLNDIGYVIQAPSPGKEVTMRMELYEEELAISIPAMRDWCKRTGVPYKDLIASIKSGFKILTEQGKRDLGKSTSYRNGGRLNCMVLSMPKEKLE